MTLKDLLYFASTALRTLKKRARNSWCYGRPLRKKKSKKALSDFFFSGKVTVRLTRNARKNGKAKDGKRGNRLQYGLT